MSDKTKTEGMPVQRESEHFKLLFSNSPAQIPDGCKEALDPRTTVEMMYDRDSGKESAAS
jgi:hypothetical protein